MAETVNIAGLKELANALHELPNRIARKRLTSAVAAAAAIVRNEARSRAPVFTGPVSAGHPKPGTLRRSIVSKRIPGDTQTQMAAKYVVAVRHGKKYQKFGKKERNLDAFYARFVEFGTVNMAARPFLRPAFESQKYAAVGAIKSALEESLKQEAAQLAVRNPR